MDLRHRTRLGLAGLAMLTLVAPVMGSELRTSAAQRVSGVVVHDAQQTLRDYCRVERGELVFELPGGARWELVTSTSDAAVSNPGDGAFHPFDASEVATALAQVRFPLPHVSAEVFILPYPRRVSLESAAGAGLILLSPGVRPLTREHQHSEFVHELGHVVQYALLPDADAGSWSEYARLRGLSSLVNTASAPHADRPHEIWAEDFRALFGGASANSAGTIENASLASPAQVAGLASFMESLAASRGALSEARLVAEPLSRGSVSFSRSGTRAAVLDVYDAAGRRLASVQPAVGESRVSWTWDGKDRSGRSLRAAVVFARTRDGRGGAVRSTLLP